MKIPSKTKTIVFQLSAILILIAAICHFFIPEAAKYMMVCGVAAYAAVTFTTPYPGKSIRGKRMHNITIFAVLAMAVAAYLMFDNKQQWVIFLLIGAILTLYSSIAMPRIYEKEQQEDQDRKDEK